MLGDETEFGTVCLFGSQLGNGSRDLSSLHSFSCHVTLPTRRQHPPSMLTPTLTPRAHARGASTQVLFTKSVSPQVLRLSSQGDNARARSPTPSHPPRPKPLALSSINNSTNNKLSSQPCPVSSTISLASSLVISCLPSRRRPSLQSTNN